MIVLWSLVDCSNHLELAGHEKGQCLEDYLLRFGYSESLRKMVPRLLSDDQKERHMQMFQEIIEQLQTKSDLLRCHHCWLDMDFWVPLGNQTPGQSAEVSDVAGAEENKTVEVKSQSHVAQVFWCERHYS